MVTRADLSIYRGDTIQWIFRLWEDESRTQPVDLTGVVFAATIKQGTTKTTMACTVDTNAVTCTLAAADSQNLKPCDALARANNTWDLQGTWDDGSVRTIVAGSVVVIADVTGAT